MDLKAVLELQGITRVFQQGDTELQILYGVNLTVKSGEIVALLGPSGSGKSTLLQIAGLLESPTSGSVLMNNIACQTLDDEQRTLLRRQYVGFVYQFHHLLPEFSALENVMLPQFIGGVDRATAKSRAIISKDGPIASLRTPSSKIIGRRAATSCYRARPG